MTDKNPGGPKVERIEEPLDFGGVGRAICGTLQAISS